MQLRCVDNAADQSASIFVYTLTITLPPLRNINFSSLNKSTTDNRIIWFTLYINYSAAIQLRKV